jgi:hypothetical protein
MRHPLPVRVDVAGVEQPVDPVDEVDGAHSIRGIHRAVENYRGRLGVNNYLPSDRRGPRHEPKTCAVNVLFISDSFGVQIVVSPVVGARAS